MNNLDYSQNAKEVSAGSLLGSIGSNRFWPFTEGVYLLDELKPWAASAYTFIVICLDSKSAIDDYDVVVDKCDQQFSANFRAMARNMLATFPRHIFTYKGSSASLRKRLTSQWHRQNCVMMKQYFIEKGHILRGIIEPWVKEYFNPARGQFGNPVPMSGLLHTAIVYETISVPLVEKPPDGFPSQSFWKHDRPTPEFIQLLQIFREGTGITDPGSWEALREPEFYKALDLSRKLAREKVKEATKDVIGIRCYADRTLLRDACCFKRVVIDGEKEGNVATELRGFRKAQYTEAEKSLATYQAGDSGFYLTRAVLEGNISHRVLRLLFTAEEIRQAPRMPLTWIVQSKIMDEVNPTENEVSKVISPFAKVFEYPRRPGRPSSAP